MGYKTKNDIVKELVKDFDYKENDIKEKTREELLKLMSSINNIEVVEEVNTDTEKKRGDVPPEITSVEWNDYVMGHFSKEELVKGNPTVDGMRRVVELLVGEIELYETFVLQCPYKENDDRATVVVNIIVDGKKYSGAADVCWRNTEKAYAKYPVAMAETRAEGRAFKRVLRLRKVNAAEEIADESKIEYEQSISQEGKINSEQIEFLNIIGQKANINVEKFILTKLAEKSKTFTTLNNIIYEDAADLTRLIGELKINISKGETIDKELVGFDVSWKDKMKG